MTRRLFNFFTALSLLLCVAVCVLCMRSYGNNVHPGLEALRPRGMWRVWA
jgi:hypothetical protein